MTEKLTVNDVGGNTLSTSVVVEVLGECAQVKLGAVTDPGKTPWRTELGGDVRVGRQGIVNTVEVVLGVDALVPLDVSDLGRSANGVEGLRGELSG